MKHTKTPWHVASTTEIYYTGERTEQQRLIAKCGEDEKLSNEEVLANAEFIVKACNEYEQLRELLKEAMALAGKADVMYSQHYTILKEKVQKALK
jgi:monomeric isocitrate dehydrogenase